MEKQKYKAFIRVVKSIALDEFSNRFDTTQIIKEPLIEAKDKEEVKQILLKKYPQFFQNNKVYEKETKDKAQFFYVVIFPLYNHELKLIEEGSWTCDYCGQVHENKYLFRPIVSRKFEGKIFCGNDYETGNDLFDVDCYEKWKKEIAFKDCELPDDLNYINVDSLNYIYKVTEKLTGKCYIGKTRNAPFFRWWNHLKHSNTPFGKILSSSSLENWTFEVLKELPSNMPDAEIFKIESEFMVKYDSINNGFNTVISNKSVLENNKPNLFNL